MRISDKEIAVQLSQGYFIMCVQSGKLFVFIPSALDPSHHRCEGDGGGETSFVMHVVPFVAF